MRPPRPRRYNRAVRNGWWRGAALAFLVPAVWLLTGAPAGASEQIDTGSAPVVNVQLSTGTLTVQTWDKPYVKVESAGTVQTQRIAAANVHAPRAVTIDSERVDTPRGPVIVPATLFALPPLGGSHNAVIARGSGNTTVTIPRGSALVSAHVGEGQINLNGYHGVFVTSVHEGSVALNGVSGTGFVETLHGPVTATDSTFSRLQARTVTGDMVFRGCTAHQIEAISNSGSIVYDNGRFEPGLARFESVHGNVALGVRGGAQVGAHTTSGHIVSSFHNNARMSGSGNSQQATIRGGGPLVTAASKNGSVYLYNGSMGAHPRLQNELHANQLPQPPPGYPAVAPPPPPGPWPGVRAGGRVHPRHHKKNQPQPPF